MRKSRRLSLVMYFIALAEIPVAYEAVRLWITRLPVGRRQAFVAIITGNRIVPRFLGTYRSRNTVSVIAPQRRRRFLKIIKSALWGHIREV